MSVSLETQGVIATLRTQLTDKIRGKYLTMLNKERTGLRDPVELLEKLRTHNAVTRSNFRLLRIVLIGSQRDLDRRNLTVKKIESLVDSAFA